jgi:hypothetical protein
MDHSEALRLQAAERYVLGELSPELRDEYEEHYFDCEECAADVKAAAAFADGARELFRKGRSREEKARLQGGGWFDWLRPAIAAPAVAVLLLIVGYQSLVTVPKLRREAAAPMSPHGADFVSLIGANSRNEGTKTFRIHRDRPAILEIDIPVSGEFAAYVCELQNTSGHTVHQSRISAADARSTVHLIIPKGELVVGSYTLAILGERASLSNTDSRNEVERLTFSVEVLP